MKREILREAVKLNIAHRRRRRWHRVVSVMAGVVVFVTTYALILPAITMEHETICGLDEHAHSQACYYTPVLNTGRTLQCVQHLHVHEDACYAFEDSEICGYADFVVHTHDASCYNAELELICSLPERYEHTHTDLCWQEQMVYTCGQDEGAGSHTHNDACYTPAEPVCQTEEAPEHTHSEYCYGEVPLICETEASDGHSHDEACYGTPELICQTVESPEHTHSDDCYGEAPLICETEASDGHSHSEACYGTPEPTCQLTESAGHTHDAQCYPEKQLLCTLEEQPGHLHDETCGAEITRELVCEQEEVILHTHTAECFDEAGMIICGMRQVLRHQHDDKCFTEHSHTLECYAENESGSVQICEYHVHDSDCFDEFGNQICTQPRLICSTEEHLHVESCYPPKDDGMVDVTFAVEDTYLAYIQSEAVFPLTCSLPEGISLAEYGETPILTINNPDAETPDYLDEYHWVTPDGFPVDITSPVTEDVTLTLKLYPADKPEAAQLVTATFLYEDEILLTLTVNHGSVVSDLPDAETMQKLEHLETKRQRFVGWSFIDENGKETRVTTGETVITQDVTYAAVFQEYVPITLHDIAPDGGEYPGSPLTIYVPLNEALSSRWDAALEDGTSIPACQWYTSDGTAFDAETGIVQPLELYTYSYELLLELEPKELPEESGEMEETPAAEETLAPKLTVIPSMLMMLSSSQEETDTSQPQEPTTDSGSESVSIVKRSSDALTAEDFVVDGENYSNYQWVDESGSDVDTDDLVGTRLTANYALTRAAGTTYKIEYKINVTASNVFGTVPTVGGASTIIDSYNTGDGTYTLRVPSPASYMTVDGNKKKLYQFAGWKITRSNKIIDAGEIIDGSWVSSNLNRGSKDTVTLTAQWTSVVTTETVHFFVNLNCQVADVDGNSGIPSSGDFTPSVFSTTITVTGASMKNYWQGAINRDSYSTQYILFRADNASDTAEIDAEIRRLINGHDSTYDTYNSKSVWKSGYVGTKTFQVEDFPSDENVLAVVRSMIESGTVIRMNNVKLNAADVTSENFTVRWNVCKYDTGDGWHIDGVLVGKQAHMTVKKTFLGDDTAVQAVKDGGFTITLDNTTNNSAANKILTLNPSAAESGTNLVGYTDYDPASDTYTWTLPLEQNNRYSIIENNYISSDAAIQTSASYTVSNSPDAFAGWSAYPDGGITNITAYSYANDVSTTGYQTVALRNSYVKADTLTINKIDMDTGNGLPGVSYRLTDAVGNGLTLYRKPDTSYYSMKAEDLNNGFVPTGDSVITTGSNGAIFLKLNTGTFTLKEAFPTGYGGVSAITVTVGADSNGNIIFEEIHSSDSTIQVDGVLVDKQTATLTIRNVSYPTSVTAQKIWADDKEAKEVMVALYRNDIAMGSEYQVILNKANNWTYTWQDLPLYADGAAANYTLREIRIGTVNYDPTADLDGYSGYIVAYDDLVYSQNGQPVSGPVWVDDRGITQYADNAKLVVRNEVYRGQMMFLKVDGEGNPLPGATFRLYADEKLTTVLAEATSDAYGRVIFESLMPNTYYVMKETGTPDGYLGADAMYKVRLSVQGSTTVEDTSTGEPLTAIVNYADEVDVQIYKISTLERPLAGAQFLLEQQVDGVWTELGTYASGSDGLASLGTLGNGSYRLTEQRPPDGYNPLDGPLEFTVYNAMVTAENPGAHWGVAEEGDTGLFTIRVVNSTGYELPQTGGPTAQMYTYGGLLLILAALTLFGYQTFRRKEENSS